MFELNESLTHIQAAPDRVVAIISSLNKPDVITTQQRPEPTQAYVISVQEGSGLQMYVYLYHEKSHLARIYPWGGDPITRASFSDVEGLALEFTESMGFLMDNSHFRKKPPEERQAFFDALPCFRGDLETYARAQDAKEDPSLLDLTEDIQDLEEMEIPEEGAAESAAEGGDEQLEMVDLEESAEAAPVEELVELEPEGGEELEIENIEAAPEAAGGEEIDADDPFGEMAVEPGEEAPQEGEGFADVLSGLDDLEDAEGAKNAAELFGDEDTGDLENELDSSIDAMLNEEQPAAPEPAEEDKEELVTQALAGLKKRKLEPEEEVLEPGQDAEADVSPVVDVENDVDLSDEPPPEEQPPPDEEFSLDLETDGGGEVEMDALEQPAPKLDVKSASTFEQMMAEEPPMAAAAAPSLEEELESPAAPAAPRLDPKEARERLEKLGRLLSAW